MKYGIKNNSMRKKENENKWRIYLVSLNNWFDIYNLFYISEKVFNHKEWNEKRRRKIKTECVWWDEMRLYEFTTALTEGRYPWKEKKFLNLFLVGVNS